jgi:hypothetical protein
VDLDRASDFLPKLYNVINSLSNNFQSHQVGVIDCVRLLLHITNFAIEVTEHKLLYVPTLGTVLATFRWRLTGLPSWKWQCTDQKGPNQKHKTKQNKTKQQFV